MISGTFTRFSDAEILARYPTQQTYVRRVALAAVALAQRHYITDDDAAALALAAESESLADARIGLERRGPWNPRAFQASEHVDTAQARHGEVRDNHVKATLGGVDECEQEVRR